MADLINKQVAIEALQDAKKTYFDRAVIIGIMQDIINDLPTIDAIPVVRCKDCKYAHITYDGKYCKYCELEKDEDGFLIEQYYESDYFCAYGECNSK